MVVDNIKAKNIDDFQACLKTVLEFYNIQIDISGVMTTLPYKNVNDAEPIDMAINLLDAAGLKAEKTILNRADFEKTDTVNILLLSDGVICILYPQKTHKNMAYTSKFGNCKVKDLDDKLINYTGEAIKISPPPVTTNSDTEHMYQGHVMDWFWRPIFSNWGVYSEIFVCTIFINLFVLALPLFTMNVYDRVVANFVESTLIVLTIGVTLALFFDFIFKTMRAYLLERVATKIGIEYDFKLMNRLLNIHSNNMPMSVGERANIFRELQAIRDFYAIRLAPTVIDLPFFILFIFVIYLISPILAIIPVIGSAIMLLVNFLIQIPIERITKDFFSSMQVKTTTLIETLSGTEAVHLFNSVGARLFKWNIVSADAANCSRYNNTLISIASNLSFFISQLTYVAIIFFGIYQISAGSLTIGGLIACSILSSRAIAPVMNLSNLIARSKQSKDLLCTIDKIFQLPYENNIENSKAPKGPFKGDLTIKNLYFQYTGENKLALNNVSLTIKAGERVGLVGKSGAGKSTLAKIITQQLQAQKGNILLDTYDYSNISPIELRQTLGVVPQDTIFFSATIKENIILGNLDVDEDSINNAIKISGLDIVMEQTGYGLDMEVGENGSKLSGGQKQAIAIARALVHNPKILVFDEPTTGMDNILEDRLRCELNKYLQNRSFVMVTHRTTLLPLVDRLIVMDGGRIVADGSRDEIIKKITSKI